MPEQQRPQHLDMAGKPILRGSLFVYATKCFSSSLLKCGIVRDLQWRDVQRWVHEPTMVRGGHYEPALQPKLVAITAENNIDYSLPYDAAGARDPVWHLQKGGKGQMLDIFGKVLVVDEGALPAHVVTMLREALDKHGE